jgi:hypothetical protein
VLLCVILRAIVAMRQTLKSFFPSQPAETWNGGCVLRPRLGVAGSTVSRMGASDAKSAALLRREVQPGPSAAYHTGGSRCGLWLREQGRDLASARSRRRNRPHSFRQSLQNAIARRLCRFRGRESHDLRFRKRGTFFSYSSPSLLKLLSQQDVTIPGCLWSRSDTKAAWTILFSCWPSPSQVHKVKAHHPGAVLLLRIRTDDRGARCPLGVKYGALMCEVEHLLRVADNLHVPVAGNHPSPICLHERPCACWKNSATATWPDIAQPSLSSKTWNASL